MARLILIDGYNVILRDPALSALFRQDEPSGRGRLFAMVSRWMAGGSTRAIVVFDARGGTEEGRLDRGTPRGVDAVFARDADAWIRRRLSDTRRPAAVTVVTSDDAVARFSQAHGAAVRSSEAFLEAVRASTTPGSGGGEKPAGETRAGVEYWLGRFSEGQGD